MSKQRLKFEYLGSKFWLIFWAIFFFPIAIILFAVNSDFVKNDSVHRVRYSGSKFWLCFWILFCFPIALVLFFLNGFYIESDS